jgi:hypothetical protein
MDKYNTFHSRSSYALMRLDYFVVMAVLSIATLAHAGEVNWVRFAVAFAWIDLVGTLPAWFVYYKRRSGPHRRIPTGYHHLYNFCHSLTANALLIVIWYLAIGGFEWAMLAAPIHILGDRSLFGNVYKPPGLSFEPAPHPGYARFIAEYERGGLW